MPSKNSDKDAQYPTARPSNDSMGLGPTGGQRGAEILAGLRARLHPSPETEALSRFAGRIVARIITGLIAFGGDAALNYVAFRPAAFEKFISDYIRSHRGDDITIVELAAGFSPRALMMAQNHPDVQFIEIDLPGVIKDKQKRLQSNYEREVPSNLTWKEADLGTQALDEVLDQQQVDVITLEGLTAYFKADHITEMVQKARQSLKPGGLCIADMAWQVGMDEEASRSGVNLFARQAGNFLTIVQDADEARQIFADAGYTQIDIYETNALAEQLPGIATPVTQFSLIVVASYETADDSEE